MRASERRWQESETSTRTYWSVPSKPFGAEGFLQYLVSWAAIWTKVSNALRRFSKGWK